MKSTQKSFVSVVPFVSILALIGIASGCGNSYDGTQGPIVTNPEPSSSPLPPGWWTGGAECDPVAGVDCEKDNSDGTSDDTDHDTTADNDGGEIDVPSGGDEESNADTQDYSADRTPPTGTLVSVKKHEKRGDYWYKDRLFGRVALRAAAYDPESDVVSGVTKVDYYVNGRVVGSGTDASKEFEYVLDTTRYGNIDVEFKIRVWDKAGNSSEIMDSRKAIIRNLNSQITEGKTFNKLGAVAEPLAAPTGMTFSGLRVKSGWFVDSIRGMYQRAYGVLLDSPQISAKKIGGAGGAEMDLNCQNVSSAYAHEYRLKGLKIRRGEVVDSVVGVCENIRNKNAGDKETPRAGGTGGSTSETLMCKDDGDKQTYIWQIEASVRKFNGVDVIENFRIHCK